MMGGLRGFAAKCKAFARSLPDQVNAIKQRTALEILDELYATTPKDTGEAVSNYVISNWTRNREFRKGPYTTDGSMSDGPNRAAIFKTKALTPIRINNNAPHIGLLNAGHSKQAPAGFIEKAVQNGKEKVRRSTVRFNKSAVTK